MTMLTEGLILLALGTSALLLTIACIIRRDLRKLEGVGKLVLAARQVIKVYEYGRFGKSGDSWVRCDEAMRLLAHRANIVSATLPDAD